MDQLSECLRLITPEEMKFVELFATSALLPYYHDRLHSCKSPFSMFPYSLPQATENAEGTDMVANSPTLLAKVVACGKLAGTKSREKWSRPSALIMSHPFLHSLAPSPTWQQPFTCWQGWGGKGKERKISNTHCQFLTRKLNGKDDRKSLPLPLFFSNFLNPPYCHCFSVQVKKNL